MRANKAGQELIGGLIHLTFLIHGRKKTRHRPWIIAGLVHDLHANSIGFTLITTAKRHATVHRCGLTTHHHRCRRITIDGRCRNRSKHSAYLHQQSLFSFISAAFIMALTDVRDLVSHDTCQLIHAARCQYRPCIKTNHTTGRCKRIDTWIVNNNQTKRCLLACLRIKPPRQIFNSLLNPRVMLHFDAAIDIP